MNYLTSTLRAATGVAVASLVAAPLAGCSGASPALPSAPISSARVQTSVTAPDSTTSQIQPDGKKKKQKQLLFVSDNENNRVLVYNAASKTQNPSPVRTITNGIQGPNGLATDESGNLYVANYIGSTVTVYAPNSSTPKLTIANGVSGPFDVKVDAFGNVYVANDPLYGGIPFIQLYPAGSTVPSYTWTAPTKGTTISGIALLDPTIKNQTAIYALGYTLNGSGFATGFGLSCFPGTATCLTLGYNFGQTGGIAVSESPGLSKAFQFLAVDQYIPGVDIITPGGSTTQLVTGGTPEFITLNAADNQLFVADRFYGRVVEYSFPAGKEINTFSPGGAQVYGVATSPAGTYH
ncbi:MAG TPA: SMP-30/gluconolactonase/LRE family protein [Candidatus Dormibacteraeota bacterium]|nr:SMP-30/gluconolactonase/LRE family protein [Candidatus Dormibacteraeota bacterium]